MRINRRVCGLAAVACLAMTATACGGDGGEEAVFLYFINGYPGTGDMTINSNRGALVSGVPFGERYGEGNTSCGPDTTDCLPVRVDRQLGSEFTVILENMVEPVEITKELFSMYPHETGTVVLTRRSGESDVDTTLLRHTQSISSDCILTFVNGLSTDNQYLGLGTYSITPELLIEDISQAGFGDEAGTSFISECGALPIDDPTHENLQRPGILEQVRDNPWFLLDTVDGQLSPAWGIPTADGRSRVDEGGSFNSILNSQEYVACIQGAISIRQPEDAMVPVFPGAEVDCPPGPLTWADVDVDFQAVQACQGTVKKSATLVAPGQEDTAYSISAADGSGLLCELEFRIRNEGQDILFGPKGNDDLGSHGNGAPVRSEVNVPAGSQRFYVLLGRLVNPIVWQWDSSESFVDLGFYPYFNEGGDRPVVGDYDR